MVNTVVAAVFSICLLFQVYIVAFSVLSGRANSLVYAAGVNVSGATVVAYGVNGSGMATTNLNGQYNINEGLKTGNYSVRVIKEGYVSLEIPNVLVAVGSATTQNMHLNLSGGIHGTVVESGIPAVGLEGVVVTAIPSEGNSTYGWTAVTDANGNYSMATNLGAVAYNITAFFPAQHVPNTVTISAVEGIMLAAPDLALDPSGIVTGRVTDPYNNPLKNASVTAISTEYMGFAQTNETGYYVISSGLGRGSYGLIASYLGFFSNPTSVSLSKGQKVDYINFQVTYPPPEVTGTISGKITDKNSNPIAGAHVTADGGAAGSGSEYTDDEGNYVMTGDLGAGTYTVTASALGYLTQNITGVTVTVDHTTSNVNLALSRIPAEQSGSIIGTVTGEAGAIPEVQNPIAIAIITSAITFALVKSLKKKAKQSR
jgi:hypothetical protein